MRNTTRIAMGTDIAQMGPLSQKRSKVLRMQLHRENATQALKRNPCCEKPSKVSRMRAVSRKRYARAQTRVLSQNLLDSCRQNHTWLLRLRAQPQKLAHAPRMQHTSKTYKIQWKLIGHEHRVCNHWPLLYMRNTTDIAMGTNIGFVTNDLHVN